MWPDNQTERDFLNFASVADTVAEVIEQSAGRPVSVGVSGAWGVGKSSMIRMIRRALEQRATDEGRKFLFVEFNAWLYQGYDDARAALVEVIADTLMAEAEKTKTGLEKVTELLKRVDWLRAARLSAGSAAALALGMPPLGLAGEVVQLCRQVLSGVAGDRAKAEVDDLASGVITAAAGLIRPKAESSPPKEIEAIRACFREAVTEMGVTLVLLIDDLDRCLPVTTISTLEAIRLFLFLENTAFVIAADDQMIKHAVKHHFEGVDSDTATNYFDKLVQVPIRVPPLGTQEVRAYMMLLFVEDSRLDAAVKENIRESVCGRLGLTWQGKRVDRSFVESLHTGLPPELVSRLDTADRLAPVMTTASHIAGNPRLIKRFLNALAIRMAMARSQGVGVDEAALAKMLLFERCADPKAYAELTKAVVEDDEGKASLLADWEEKTLAGEDLKLPTSWDNDFVREWLALAPRLADLDLRGVLYVSREHAPLITPEDRLSSRAAELLSALLEHPDMAADLRQELSEVPAPERSIMMQKLLDRARQDQVWGTPPILDACLAVAEVDAAQASGIAAFLSQRPAAQIKPSIVPKISDRPWAPQVFEAWKTAGVSSQVEKAIAQQGEDGNITV